MPHARHPRLSPSSNAGAPGRRALAGDLLRQGDYRSLGGLITNPPIGRHAAIDEMFTMAPERCWRIIGMACLQL